MSNWRYKDLMGALTEFAETEVAPAVNDALGLTEPLVVSRYQPRNANMPALWHERRTGTSVGLDTNTSRDVVYVAVMVAARWSDEGRAEEQTETMLDVVRELYSKKARERLPFGVHRVKRFGVEIPTPTSINDVVVIVAGVVLEVHLDLPVGWPS